MSKSTRLTPQQLEIMGLEEVSEGVYAPKKNQGHQVTEIPPSKPTESDKPIWMQPDIGKKNFERFKMDILSNSSDVIKLVVLGEPTPQQRHRHHQAKGAKFVTTYDPSSKKKKEFLKACLPYKPEKPFEQPLRVDMVFYFSRPKSHYRTGKYAHILKDDAPEYHTSRNDIDNIQKFVFDALNKVFWKDDSCISAVYAIKKYDDNPRTEITIIPL